ncbi:hypothetical protein BD289DRAFT_445825 [Coniella lustricola]|uniref:Uncharacterized protein n=1 Tax=Coniella lustricola TaxID=2025994 RepID=A0A2T2ZUN1_9PEZI|nr:hypothetical protein BD289DRAFT_445825 [Coniella lustricola]
MTFNDLAAMGLLNDGSGRRHHHHHGGDDGISGGIDDGDDGAVHNGNGSAGRDSVGMGDILDDSENVDLGFGLGWEGLHHDFSDGQQYDLFDGFFFGGQQGGGGAGGGGGGSGGGMGMGMGMGGM